MKCDKCGAEMIAQTNKKNEKAPDWKCSDANCKWKFNYNTQEWEESDFITGKWNPKPATGTLLVGDIIKDHEARISKIEERLNIQDGF